jgi:hypothetical protein
MRQISITTILFWLTLTVNGQQHPAVSQPGYNPTVPSLISMRHKAVSFIDKPLKMTIQDFEQKQNKEDINVYVVYEKDSTVGKSSGTEELFNPPQKLMDLYLIYDYTYKIYCSTKEEINGRIPKIYLESGGFVDELKVVTYYIDDKGKLKDKKIKKSGFSSEVTNGFLSIQLDQSQLIQNSFVEVNIQIKTRDFAKLIPSISSGDSFNKSLTISYPTILNYKITDNPSLELTSSSTSQFELLHFSRDSGAGNGNIKTLKVDSKIFSWKISTKENKYKIEFELAGLNIPLSSDIGIGPTDIVRMN